MKQFRLYEQVAYLPLHVQGLPQRVQLNHPDVEFGFIMSFRAPNCFVRYWRKGKLGELRTVANSEGTSERDLRHVPPHSRYRLPNSAVMEAVEQIMKGETNGRE